MCLNWFSLKFATTQTFSGTKVNNGEPTFTYIPFSTRREATVPD